MSETADQDVARAAEVVIGLGVDPVEGCSLCGRDIPCPAHVGAAIAVALAPVIAARESAAAFVALWDASTDADEIPCGYASPAIRSVRATKRWLRKRAQCYSAAT